MSLDDALVWFIRFGANPQCISPAGRELFAFLLSRVAELERAVPSPSHAPAPGPIALPGKETP